jgi:hypothetical protein
MFRCLVGGGGIGVAINFHQHEPRRVVLLLQDVKTQDTQFEPAAAGVEPRRLFERLHAIGFDMNMNVNNEHGGGIRENTKMLKRAERFSTQ